MPGAESSTICAPLPGGQRFRSPAQLTSFPRARLRQRKRDPAGADGKFQHPPAARPAGEELDRSRRIEPGIVLVIIGRPAVAIERRIFEPSQAAQVPSGLRCKSASVASGFMMMLRGGGDSPWGTGEKS